MGACGERQSGPHTPFRVSLVRAQDLVNKLPHKIDIGAIFSAAPRDHKKYKLFEPLQREFIIDSTCRCAGGVCASARRGSLIGGFR